MNQSNALLALAAFALGGTTSLLLQRGLFRRQADRFKRRTRHLPEPQLRDWIESSPQGWVVLRPNNGLASINERAQTLLKLEASITQQRQQLEDLDPPDEVRHLIQLARNSGLPQRGEWSLSSDELDLRVMPGRDGWVAILLQGCNPLQQQLEQQAQWVSDVAHELKTPITALRLVSDSLGLQAKDRQAVLVGRLQKELERLQLLVSDLLDLSRLENTPVEDAPKRGAIDPRDVLGDVLNTLEDLAAERNISFQVTPGRDQALQAAVDPARLHQALFNLVDNALRFSPEGRPIHIAMEQWERWCSIAVRDQGPGLSDTDLERMFQRFYRGDPSRARNAKGGSGLGLAIVKQIALSQGGMVRARNHPKGGAVLELLLPRL
ncbi:MAG: sensor histidine kinase [Vulcanococcus sp.]